MKDAGLIKKIAKFWKRIKDFRIIDCKLAILDRIEKYLPKAYTNRFVCQTDQAEYISFSQEDQYIKLPETIIIIISPKELIICDVKAEIVIDTISFGFIVSWEFGNEGIFIYSRKNNVDVTINLDTEQGTFIDFLLKGYTEFLAKKEVIIKKNKHIEEEKLKYSEIISPVYIEKQKAKYQIVYPISQ